MSQELKYHRGTVLKVGQKVAFNYCGEIGLGTIQEIKFSKPKKNYKGETYQTHTIFVRRLYPSYPSNDWSDKPKVSKVTSCKNLMVIFEVGG